MPARPATRARIAVAAAVAVALVLGHAGLARAGDDDPGHEPRATIPPTEYAPDVFRYGARPAATTAAVGTVRSWLSLDERQNRYVATPFRLGGVGNRVEVWIASDLAFPSGDCRNTVDGGSRIAVTAQQVAYLVDTFDRQIHPRLSSAFSVPPPRDGSRSRADPARYDPRGDGEAIVVLVDNVRDANYYDRDNAGNLPYIAGFFTRDLVEFFDRNVLTVDAYDWLHRTGPSPPHQPVADDLCLSAPARPHLYEGVLAHEYQHLLMYYEDANEVTWVDEGLADLAQRIAGFLTPARSIHEVGHDTHVQCFLGWLATRTAANPNPRPGGPENSLTRWGEHAGEGLCDYGAAYTFMELLVGRYGIAFVRALHREDANGFDGLRNVLRARRVRTTVPDLVRDWAAMSALDDVLDRGARFTGPRARFRTPALRAAVNWDNARAYDKPGAPPNGSDFVRLRDARGTFLRARDLRSLRFSAPAGTFSLQLVAYRAGGGGRAHHARVTLRNRRASLDRSALRRLLGTDADVVSAIVTAHDASGESARPLRYRLAVNGTVQPGG